MAITNDVFNDVYNECDALQRTFEHLLRERVINGYCGWELLLLAMRALMLCIVTMTLDNGR